MSIPGLGDVVTNLTLARGSIQQARDVVDQAGIYARGADQALQDAEAETTRARMGPGGPLGASYLIRAGVQLHVLRQRCTLTANLAGQVEERLDIARGQVVLAREHLDALEQGPDLARGEAATVPGLHASVEAIREFLELAARLAQATRRHLEEAAETAYLLMTPSLADDAREHAVLRIDRGVQTAGRSVARAEEAARHLQRGVEYADTGTARSLAHADALANLTPPAGSRSPTWVGFAPGAARSRQRPTSVTPVTGPTPPGRAGRGSQLVSWSCSSRGPLRPGPTSTRSTAGCSTR